MHSLCVAGWIVSWVHLVFKDINNLGCLQWLHLVWLELLTSPGFNSRDWGAGTEIPIYGTPYTSGYDYGLQGEPSKGTEINAWQGQEIFYQSLTFLSDVFTIWYCGAIEVRALNKQCCYCTSPACFPHLVLALRSLMSFGSLACNPHSVLFGAFLASTRLQRATDQTQEVVIEVTIMLEFAAKSGTREQTIFGGGHKWLSSSDWGKQQMDVSDFLFSSRADLGGWVTKVWPYTEPCTFQPGHWSKLGRDTGCVEMVCVVTLKVFFSQIKFGQCSGIALFPSPPCPGQLA